MWTFFQDVLFFVLGFYRFAIKFVERKFALKFLSQKKRILVKFSWIVYGVSVIIESYGDQGISVCKFMWVSIVQSSNIPRASIIMKLLP